MVGFYQYRDEARRHLAEFDFRYNRRAELKVADVERHNRLLALIECKHLAYRRNGESSYA